MQINADQCRSGILDVQENTPIHSKAGIGPIRRYFFAFKLILDEVLVA
jgi:hypothetical protein